MAAVADALLCIPQSGKAGQDTLPATIRHRPRPRKPPNLQRKSPLDDAPCRHHPLVATGRQVPRPRVCRAMRAGMDAQRIIRCMGIRRGDRLQRGGESPRHVRAENQ